MKNVMKLAVLAVVASLSVSVAQAAPKQKIAIKSYETTSRKAGGSQYMSGCGLGSMVVEDPSKWAQVLSATLNGTSGNQTFGITFGTSNCVEDGAAMASREKDAFVEANYADIRRDLAAGNGAYLSSLASLYGCRGEAAVDFSKALRSNQEQIINATPDTASRVIESVVTAERISCQG